MSASSSPTEQDIQKLAWTMLGEAYPGDTAGMSAVGNTVLNRLNSGNYGSTISDVVTAPNAYAAWGIGSQAASQGNHPDTRFPVGSPEYNQAYGLAQQLVTGAVPDNTGGAVNYRAAGHAPSSWGDNTVNIGGNTFQTTHPVPPSDIPTSIADTSGVDLATLQSLNSSVAPSSLTAGDELAFNPVTTDDTGGIGSIPAAFGNLNAAPNSSGGPDDRSLDKDYYPPSYTPVPLAPLPAAGSTYGGIAPAAATSSPAPLAGIAADSGATPQTVTVNGHTYQVGQILSAGGNTYKVQADGSFVKAPRDTFTSGTVAGGVVGKAISSAAASAPAALGNLGNTVGGFIGGLFGGGGGSSTPAAPTTDVANNAGWDNLIKSFGSSAPSTYGGVNATADTSYPYLNIGSIAPVPAPEPITGTDVTPSYQQQLNPAYTAWVNSQGAAINGVEGVDTPSLDANGNVVLPSSYAGVSTPAPAKFISVPVPAPALAKQLQTVGLSADDAHAAAAASAAIAAPNGYNYQSNGNGGYTNVGQQNPNLTPAQVYNQAAAKALASQPRGGSSNGGSPYASNGSLSATSN